MNNMDGFTQAVVILLVTFIVSIVALTAIMTFDPERRAVCHSASEDSPITDCDYRDGGWYKR
jgi:hypothetical protein